MAKKKKSQRIPQSSEAKAARQALIAADLMGWESDRQRLSSLTRGAYTGSPSTRSTGSGIRTRYRIGNPKPDPAYLKLFGLTNDKAAKERPLRNPKSQPARLIKRSGGGRKTLRQFRRLSLADRRRLVQQAKKGRSLTRLTRSRFRR